jgi:hypothetical protein
VPKLVSTCLFELGRAIAVVIRVIIYELLYDKGKHRNAPLVILLLEKLRVSLNESSVVYNCHDP